jgi:cell division protein FtsB
MKKIVLLIISMAFTGFAFGQKLSKEDMEAKIDTLTKANAALVATTDSLNKQIAPLVAIYDTLKASYFKTDFTAKDVTSKMEGLMAQNKSAADSLLAANTELKAQNTSLKAQVDTLANSAEATQKEKDQVVRDLQIAKDLLDKGILTEEEFQTIKKKYISKL